MPHINLPPNIPGVVGPMVFSPETARPLNSLVDVLLRDNALLPDSTISAGERELIAAFTSARNDCYFCQTIHGAVASHRLGDTDWSLVESVKADYQHAAISDKLKALLTIAGCVQQGGHYVTTEQVEAARALGATDRDIHDTVLIAAAFCMFNRYVDGLATVSPVDAPDIYRGMAADLVEKGYQLT
jgi:uncharacterized peroxidase-related enzyme